MVHQSTVAVTGFLLSFMSVYAQEVCKEPYVEKRLLADDVRYASPFYVIALPRTTNTEQMDNVCYTYFENNNGPFNHIISVTYKNGSNTFFTFTKGDIADRMGLAEAKGLTDSKCIYHDYTLKPICNVTVFILYRCFTEGSCGNIDIGITPGVDVRVVLAANPQVSSECRQETQTSLKDTMTFRGGDYILLPQKLKPQCVTKYNDSYSINYQRAVGSQEVKEEGLSDRFGQDKIGLSVGNANFKPVQSIVPQKPTPGVMNSRPGNQVNAGRTHPYTPSSSSVSSSSAGVSSSSSSGPVKGYAWSQSSFRIGSPSTLKPGYTPVQNFWGQNNGQWNAGSSQWNGQTSRPGAENHFNVWQSPIMPSKEAAKNPNNVYYHAYNWENLPPGCCKCN
uniref:Uncharacterized protein n=1 Tax=Homalodisca liturata TaxID=320908 RepID=A0A1B6K1J3_9HEMI